MERRIVNSGEVFNNLTVIMEERKRKNERMFLCKCSCGKEAIISLNSLTQGKTKSCGCLRYGNKNAKSTHGLTNHDLYIVWKNMLSRCYNRNNKEYKHYGARGIKVCERWKKVENFINDMCQSFVNGLQIDRINNDGNYCKENCKWSNRSEQQNNKRNNHMVTYRGNEYTLTELSRISMTFGISCKALLKRLEAGWDPIDAVERQLRSRIKIVEEK